LKALSFKYSIPRYLLTGLLDRRWPGILFSNLAPVQLREVPEPVLPGPAWVKIKPRLSGLCGSDMGIISCHESLTLQPFASYPFVLGHEVCGDIVEAGREVEGFEVGDRVTVMCMLGCEPRGITPPCRECAAGRSQLCENFTTGSLPAGTIVGATADVPGYLSELGVAHVSQLYKIPPEVSDEAAVMTDPFASGLHMAIQNDIQPGETLLVFGCGVMGLATVAALHALHPDCRLLAVEPSPFHADMARRMGVEEVLPGPLNRKFYRRLAELTGAKMFTPLMTRPLLAGGVDRVFDTVGSTDTINTSLRVLRGGGWFNLLGIGEPKHVDWTPVWFKELTIKGVYGYQQEEHRGEKLHDFELALRLHQEGRADLTPLVTHRFKLDQWQEALDVAMHKGEHRAVKIAFVPG
jgi:threonine dehydrogenase-like Zn-dependent dehydrogenase